MSTLGQRRPILDRLLEKCAELESGCWEFNGTRNKNGYGMIGRGGKYGGNALAHRVSYEQFVCEIPEGLHLDHLCRNRACVNPWHLEPVTAKVNLNRSPLVGGWKRRVTHCPVGHAYDATNTYITAQGTRNCKACKNADSRRRRALRRAIRLGVES